MITLLVVVLLSWNGAEDTSNQKNSTLRSGVSFWLGGRLHFPLGSNGERYDCLANKEDWGGKIQEEDEITQNVLFVVSKITRLSPFTPI